MRRIHLVFTAVVIGASSSGIGMQEVPGERVVMRYSSRVIGEGPTAAAMQAQAGEWTTVTVTARGRMRTDVTEGAQPGSKPGDYVLMDREDVITVHPASKSFERFRLVDPGTNRLADSLGIRQVIDSLRVAVDTAVVLDTVAGAPAHRYTLRVAVRRRTTFDTLRMNFPMPDMSISTTMVMENWYALEGTVAPAGARAETSTPTWATSMARLGGEELFTKLRDAMAGLPKRPVLKTRLVTMVSSEAGGAGMERTSRVEKRESVSVNLDGLILPADYVEAGNYIARGDTLWVPKWRARP